MTDDGMATLTIGVYRVNGKTGERITIKPKQVVKSDGPLQSSQFPACSCPRCVKR